MVACSWSALPGLVDLRHDPLVLRWFGFNTGPRSCRLRVGLATGHPDVRVPQTPCSIGREDQCPPAAGERRLKLTSNRIQWRSQVYRRGPGIMDGRTGRNPKVRRPEAAGTIGVE